MPKKVVTPGSYNLENLVPSAPHRKKIGPPPTRGREHEIDVDQGQAPCSVYRVITKAVQLVTKEKRSRWLGWRSTEEESHAKDNFVLIALKTKYPDTAPALGRPQEVSKVVEEASIKCSEICASYNHLMCKRGLQDLDYAYCLEHGVNTRWKDNCPANSG
jgi:hypothetical protein